MKKIHIIVAIFYIAYSQSEDATLTIYKDGLIQFDPSDCQCLAIRHEIRGWHIPAPLARPMGGTPRAVLREGFN